MGDLRKFSYCSGYMSPEYALDGLFSFKSDIFSFGVVVIEIISGKRNTGFYQPEESLSLLGYVSVLKFFRLVQFGCRVQCHIL